eukprot:c9165_g1_i2.p1 GENE.c9165_g1_i2~~c9165_g1_i2.p1  ORF type:complete len:546 (+),score=116.54 c9165_g1_i2:27-1640(+)
MAELDNTENQGLLDGKPKNYCKGICCCVCCLVVVGVIVGVVLIQNPSFAKCGKQIEGNELELRWDGVAVDVLAKNDTNQYVKIGKFSPKRKGDSLTYEYSDIKGNVAAKMVRKREKEELVYSITDCHSKDVYKYYQRTSVNTHGWLSEFELTHSSGSHNDEMPLGFSDANAISADTVSLETKFTDGIKVTQTSSGWLVSLNRFDPLPVTVAAFFALSVEDSTQFIGSTEWCGGLCSRNPRSENCLVCSSSSASLTPSISASQTISKSQSTTQTTSRTSSITPSRSTSSSITPSRSLSSSVSASRSFSSSVTNSISVTSSITPTHSESSSRSVSGSTSKSTSPTISLTASRSVSASVSTSTSSSTSSSATASASTTASVSPTRSPPVVLPNCTTPCTSSQACINNVCMNVGRLSFSMKWSTSSDIDIVVVTPNRKIISYKNKGPDAGTDQGYLDFDTRVGPGQENVFFGESTNPPSGSYFVCAQPYKNTVETTVTAYAITREEAVVVAVTKTFRPGIPTNYNSCTPDDAAFMFEYIRP